MIVDDVPFDEWALTPVFSRLSDQHKQEMHDAGWHPVAVFAELLKFISLGEAHTIRINGWPEAVLAVAKGHLWFVATEEYFDAGPVPIRHGRRLVKRLISRHGHLIAHTLSTHPAIDRWMRLHGGALYERRVNSALYIFR